jgi:release factor glutamine methyltransferase
VTFHELVLDARSRFIRAGIREQLAGLDAELLARHVLGWTRARFLADWHEEATERFVPHYERLVARRERREPIPYITGVQEFWGLPFEVNPAVLIPRPETEFILEEAIACLEAAPETGAAAAPDRQQGRRSPLEIVDVGTGCGCLAVALARHFPDARIFATDLSGAALAVARRNAFRHGVAHRVQFVETSFLTAIEIVPTMIVSNPPYVPSVSARGLVPEVRDFEPELAVFGGPDGLDGLREVLSQAAAKLAPAGWLIVEFGYGQEDAVTELIANFPCYSLLKLRRDLQGIPRTAVVRKAA